MTVYKKKKRFLEEKEMYDREGKMENQIRVHIHRQPSSVRHEIN